MSMIGLTYIAFLILIGILVSTFSNRRQLCNRILLVASYLFVVYADWRFAIILLCMTLITWVTAQKNLIRCGMIIDLLILGIFKYFNFFADSISSVIGANWVTVSIIVPIGISFYSFSAVGYLIDIKRGKTAAKGLEDVALYLAFFPKLTSGPIIKSKSFFEQISKCRKICRDDVLSALQIFVFGLFKKIVIADRLAVFVDQVYATPLAFSGLSNALATVAFSLQIYFDFSGYSDIAIASARILGIELPRNFNLPYLAQNVTEFWKRWHISLSEWLQEYLYISLGGNRKGAFRTYVNLLMTMVLGGLWHGASWNFVIWGALQGIALIIHKIWLKCVAREKINGIVWKIISVIGTFTFISFTWIFFRIEKIDDAICIIKRILSWESGINQPYLWLFFALIILFIASLFAICVSKKNGEHVINGFYPILDLSKFWQLVVFFVVCGAMIALAYTGSSPFIYGKF